MDVCIGGEVVVAGFEFGEIAAQRLPPADYAIELHSAPSDCGGAALAAETTGMLVSGEQYLVIAHGEVMPSGPVSELLAVGTVREEFNLDAGPNVVLQFFGALSAPAQMIADVEMGGYVLEEQNLWTPSLAFSEASEPITRAPGSYTLATAQVAPLPEDGDRVFPISLTPAGRDVFIFAGNPLPFGEPDENDELPTFFSVDTTVTPWGVSEFGES